MERKYRLHLLLPLIFLTLVPRLLLALGRTDLFWPDEHFQTLEPAAYWVRGNGFLAWEWHDGFRNWFVPAIYAMPFWILHFLGFNDGASWVLWSRALQAIVSSTVVASNYFLMREFARNQKLSEGWAWFTAYTTALYFGLVQWAPATLTESWALALIPAVSVFVFRRPKSHWIGAVLFIPVMFRLQCVVWSGLALGLFLIFFRAPKTWFRTALTALIPIGVMGGIDWVTWGTPFLSTINQLTRGQKIAEFYGVSPWWNGFSTLSEAASPFMLTLGGGALVATLLLIRKTQQSALAKRFYWLCVPALGFWIAHFMVSHKESRFFLPPVGLIPVWITIAVSLYTESKISAARLAEQVRQFAKPIAIWPLTVVCTMAFCAGIVQMQFPLQQVNTFWLEHRIGEFGFFNEGDCVLEVAHNWSWSRGYLVIGKKVDWREHFTIPEITEGDLQSCKVALVFEGQEEGFSTRSHWERVEKRGSYTLYKKPGLN